MSTAQASGMNTAQTSGMNTAQALGAPCPASGTWVSVPAIPLRPFNPVILRRNEESASALAFAVASLVVIPTGDLLLLVLLYAPSKKQSPALRFCSYRDPGREAFTSASARSIAANNWSGSVTSIQRCAVATTRVGVCTTPVRLPSAQSASISAAQCPEGSTTKGIACP
jgi:hypothetical protein